MQARAAQGEKRAVVSGRSGSGKHGGASEKVVETVRVERHRAGQAPKWVPKDAVGGDGDEGFLGREAAGSSAPPAGAADRRLQRLAESGGAGPSERRRGRAAEVVEEEEDDVDGEERATDRGSRRSAAAEVVEEDGPADDDDDVEDDDAIEARRERVRELARKRRQEEEALQAAEEGEEEEEEEEDDPKAAGAAGDDSEYSYETDSEEEEPTGGGGGVMRKPVFVTNSERDTIRERELREDQEEAAKQMREVRLKERADESKQLLVEAVRKDEMGGDDAKAIDFEDMPDDDDDVNELEEFEMWKVRELKRVKREKAEREKAARDAKELERRRNLTDEERKREDDEFNKGRLGHGDDKEKWRFLQKYYHKGAFYQDEDEQGNNKLGPVMAQDFGAPTGKDSWQDKSALPAPMQVKNFGFKSQVKWTHLSKEDTTERSSDGKLEASWAADKRLADKYQSRMGGAKAANDFARPAAKRRKGGL